MSESSPSLHAPLAPTTAGTAMGPIILNVRYESAPGVFEAGEFQFRQPSVADEMQIGRVASMRAAPARLSDLAFDAAYLCRCIATIEVLCGTLPKWFNLDTPNIDKALPQMLVERFWEDRAKLFRGSGADGKDEKRGPLVEIVSSVR